MTSEELYHGCRKHSDSAWQYAYNYVLKFLSLKFGKADRTILEDIAQEALYYFISRNLDNIVHPRAYKYLLRSKACCLYLEYLRKHSRWIHTPLELESEEGTTTYENPELSKSDDDFEKHLLYKEMVFIFFGIIKTMDKSCGEILHSYFRGKMDGYKVKEIAEGLQLPSNTFSVKVSRCVDKLRKYPEFMELFKGFM